MIRHNTRRAFTLIELLLVLVILAVLAAVVVPRFVGRGEQARIDATKATISLLKTPLDAYELDNGHYPTQEEGGLEALITQPANLPNWKKPYIDKYPIDGWSRPIGYRSPSTLVAGAEYDLWSAGPDGVEGTDDDITNHQ